MMRTRTWSRLDTLSLRPMSLAVSGLVILLLLAQVQSALAWPGELALVWMIERDVFNPSPTAAAWGDWDNDGDLDLAIGYESYVDDPRYKTEVYENEAGVMTLAWRSPVAHDTTSLDWGDWDGDGFLDLLEGCSDASVQIYRSGGGTLTPAWTAPLGDTTESVDWGDWDADGDLDLAVGNSEQPNRIYSTAGVTDTVSLTLAWSGPITDTTYAVAWGNWDSDPELELAVGNEAEANRVYDDQGGTWSVAWVSSETDCTRALDWGDYDGDGDLDLAVGNVGNDVNSRQKDRVYVNGGGSLALAWTSAELRWSMSTAWGDYDGDNDLDLAMGNALYQNTGDTLVMVWEDAFPTSSLDGTPFDLDAADWDGDGDDDLVNVREGRAAIFAGAGATAELDWSTFEQDERFSVAWGDMDGDGNLDLAVGNDDAPLQIYTNDDGKLSPTWTAAAVQPIRSVAWGDYDGDGDARSGGRYDGSRRTSFTQRGWDGWHSLGQLPVDRLDPEPSPGATGTTTASSTWRSATTVRPTQVYKNSGAGPSLAWSSPVTASTQSVAWGDWDDDGDLDLAVGQRWGIQPVYANDGGSLTLAWTAPISDATQSVAWGDWDKDGDLDLATGNYNGANLVYDNENTVLTQAWASAESEATERFVWGNWDGDGDLDLAVGNYAIRTGSMATRATSLPWPGPQRRGCHASVAWGDYDGDGDLDLAIGNDTDRPNHVYANRCHVPIAW